MEDQIELFKKIRVAQPRHDLYENVLDKIQAFEMDSLSRLQLFTIAAGISLLIGSGFYTSLLDKKTGNDIESAEFIYQTELYE